MLWWWGRETCRGEIQGELSGFGDRVSCESLLPRIPSILMRCRERYL